MEEATPYAANERSVFAFCIKEHRYPFLFNINLTSGNLKQWGESWLIRGWFFVWDLQCSEGCECICGLLMEGNDHSDCPVELRACPEHAAEQQRRMAEAMQLLKFQLGKPKRRKQ